MWQEITRIPYLRQIEGRGNSKLVHKLSNGEYVISYKGIMKLAEKHNIEFSVSMDNNTNTIIAKASNGNERISGKEVKICGFATTASELAKRNAARQLLPLAEIKAIEKKAQLEAKFSWEDAKAKCVELVGIEANVDIIIHELVKDGKLRQDNPSHYDRTEWLIIYEACKQDQNNDGGDNGSNQRFDTPSSEQEGLSLADVGLSPTITTITTDDWKTKLRECEQAALNAHRFYWIRDELQREGTISKEHAKDWNDKDFDLLKKAASFDASLFNRALGDDWQVIKERNWGGRGWVEGRMGRFWIMPADSKIQYSRCFVCGKGRDAVPSISSVIVSFERYEIKTPICDDCLQASSEKEVRAKVQKATDDFVLPREMYNDGKNATDTTGLPKPAEDFCQRIDNALNKRGGNATPSERTPNNADDFVNECKEAVDNVDDDNMVEANDQPLEGDNGKRKLQMDKKLRTWLVESDGTKKEISCREICEQFENKQNPSIVTRLRVGIDSGADISTVEID